MENDVSIITYKIRHNRDYSVELQKAREVADFVLDHKKEKLTSTHVKHIGLKSAISNQVIRKYQSRKNCKKISSVVLTIPGQGIQYKEEIDTVCFPCIKHLRCRKKECKNNIKLHSKEDI